MKDIECNGVKLNGKTYSVTILNFVCDAPARAFAKKTKGHCGYEGCDFCVQHGVYRDRRMTFPEVDAPARADVAFDDMQYLETGHQLDKSVLSQLNIGLVTQFPHDYMHIVCLGVVKKITVLLTSGPLHVRIGGNAKKLISETIVNLGRFLPREFIRKGRPLTEVERWKATEFRTFLLYTGPVALRGKISQALYNNFLLLFVSIRILSSEQFCYLFNEYAEQLLKVFVQNVSDIYGQQAVIYNIHGITHLASQCRLFGTLHNFSGFPFENFLQKIKKLIRKPNLPLEQAIRRMDERKGVLKTPKMSPNIYCRKKHQKGPIPEDIASSCDQYEQIVMNAYLLSRKAPDNAIIVGDKTYVIKNILVHNNHRKLVCQEYKEQVESFFQYPCDSKYLKISVVKNYEVD
ncbi:uncharacterized protein LOC124254829 [Haliotis rubra]|uniref:uncharacterized protein LOC124254829 n=1 Tax=Haliotis rubra TaxID=36100 RepID=UPI001EE551A0|nr:uncharacterized protein LOC124254829 [Haliotis rubra]